jgi:enoyl-CoA hydratase
VADQVISMLESGILTLAIHRPEQRNALNGAVLEGLTRELRRAAENRLVRVVAITGTGDRVFCAGADLKSAFSETEGDAAFTASGYREMLLAILRCPKPTVALARGHVLAGGMGVLLACDLALACDDIHLSTPEIQVGMFPMMVLALLYRNVGRKKATEMLLLGERVSAETALSLGILNQVHPRARFDAAADELLHKLARKSGSILRLGKQAIGHIEDRMLLEELEYLESMLSRAMSTADSKEGMRAFLEKRPPIWSDE